MVARPFCLLAVCLGWSPPAAAEPWALHSAVGASERLTASGSARVRYEALTGQFRPGFDKQDDLLSLRTTLFAQYDFGAVRLGGELYDSRAYDSDRGSPVSANEVNALEPVQAYLGFDLGDAAGAGTETAIDLGRYTLDLGSARLVTKENYRNTTNGFTGLHLGWKGKDGASATLMLTLPQTRLPSDKDAVLDNEVELDRESFDRFFWGAFATLKAFGDTSLDLYLFGLDERDSRREATRNRHLLTPGARILRAPKAGAWDYELEGILQLGTIRESTDPEAAKQDVFAGFVHAEIGRTWDMAWQPRLSAELDYASGDGSGGKYGRFDTLYGSRRSDFGPSGIYGPFGRANIISPGLRIELVPSERFDVFAGYRSAWLASRTDSFASTGVRNPAGASGRFAAHQIELRARYWLMEDLLQLEGGGALLLQGRFLKDAPNATGFGDTVYGYSALTVSF